MSYTIEMRFVDSNILIYAIASGSDEREKSERALRLLEEPDLATSVQVLQEFYVQATCATRKHNISHKDSSVPSQRFPPSRKDLFPAGFGRAKLPCRKGTLRFHRYLRRMVDPVGE